MAVTKREKWARRMMWAFLALAVMHAIFIVAIGEAQSWRWVQTICYLVLSLGNGMTARQAGKDRASASQPEEAVANDSEPPMPLPGR